jgi:rhodanese-related sulfurtransferase
MIKNQRVFAMLLCLCCMVSGCASQYGRRDFIEQLDTASVPYMIDVRTKGAFKKGHIPGAININVFSLLFRMDEIKAAKDASVMVYCAHGPRAGMAGFFLRLAGFKKVYHLEGDWVQWQKEGLPVETAVLPPI